MSYISQSGKKKFKKRPIYANYLNWLGPLHANEWQAYTDWKEDNLPKEVVGTIRNLLPEELQYFEFAQRYYKYLPAICARDHYFIKPPTPWIKRKEALIPPQNFILQMDALIHLSTIDCKDCISAEQNRWEDVLQPFSIASLQHLIWAITFLKSTNGMADKVSCGHFCAVIKKFPKLSLDVYKEPHTIAAILRQTSKWVKNTFVLINIFTHIEEEWNGVLSQEFKDWIIFYEIGTKTAALLFHAAFNKSSTLPVDSHVWHAFRNWGWTNAKSTDECSWHASTWMDPSYFITTNDAIGSIRQTLANKSKKHMLLQLAKKNYNLMF
jgi:endonuclease III